MNIFELIQQLKDLDIKHIESKTYPFGYDDDYEECKKYWLLEENITKRVIEIVTLLKTKLPQEIFDNAMQETTSVTETYHDWVR